LRNDIIARVTMLTAAKAGLLQRSLFAIELV
jgi:hypothetical protein